MNYSSINFKIYSPVAKSPKISHQVNDISFGNVLAKDTFVRTTQDINMEGVSKTPQVDTQIQKLFDEVFDNVLELSCKANPYVSDLDIPKPTIKYSEDDGKLASYSFTDNSIQINRDRFEKDLYLIVTKDEKGELSSVEKLVDNDNLDEILRLLQEKNEGSNFEAIKLTEDEKNFYYKSIFAHEIRHCIQSHVVMSTQGCADVIKNTLLKNKEQYEEKLEKYNSILAEMKAIDPSYVADEPERMNFDYALNYKPKKVLDESTKYKFSILPNDTRFISIRDDLLSSEVAALSGVGTNVESSGYEDDYYSSIHELDAYNFQQEYSVWNMSETRNKNTREEVLISIFLNFQQQLEMGLDILREKGVTTLNT